MAMNNKRRPMANPCLWLVFVLMCFSGPLSAQHAAGLHVGDTLPDVELQRLIRAHAEPLRTGELYRDGLLLLNFWATWCVPCVKEMELLAEQLEEYPGKFHVVGVAYEPAATVTRFLEKHPKIANSGIEIITDDVYFSQLFFHQTLPHNVWVDSNGVVQAITDGSAVTAENIAGLLSGEATALKEKREVPFDVLKPMHVPDSLIEFRGIFQKKLPGVYMGGAAINVSHSGKSKVQRFFCFNMLINDLMWKAHEMPGLTTNAYLMEVHTVDSAKFFWPGEGKDPDSYAGISRSDWREQHQFSYELRSTKWIEDSLFFDRIVADLDLNLGIKSYRALRKKQLCYVTYDPETVPLQPAKTGEKFYLGIVGTKLVARNVTLKQLIKWLSQRAYGMGERPSRKEPYIDHTGVDYPITMSIDLGSNSRDYFSFSHLEKCFAEQLGFRFNVSPGLYPVLVIEDR